VRLAEAFQKLPQRFAAGPLAADVVLFGPGDFVPYGTGGLGDAAVPLVSPGGAPTHDFALAGPARATPALARCPHIAEALAALGARIARSRLVRLTAQTSAGSAVEWNYHWFRRLLICIPIQTDAAVTLQCEDEIIHLAAGEAWILDNSRRHALHNRSTQDCVHLLVETTAATSEAPLPRGSLHLEPYRFEVLTPQELAALIEEVLTVPGGAPVNEEVRLTLALLASRWEAAFARFGHDSKGELAYQDLVLDFRDQVLPRLSPGTVSAQAAAVIDTMLSMAPPAPRKLHRPAAAPRSRMAAPIAPPEFERPLFIVSAPRAGSTLLFDLVARFGDVFTLGGESHEIIRGIPELHPAARGYASDRLTQAEARPELAAALREGFSQRLVDRAGRSYLDLPAGERPHRVRLVEKTPANALRIPFLRAIFPGALFVHLSRDPRQNISSLVEGWRARRFLAYRGMPGWPYRDWSFLLPPGWPLLADCSLVEIAAHQWQIANATIEEDLRAAPAGSSCKLDYDDLVRSPRDALHRIAKLAGFGWDDQVEAAVSAALPLSRVTLSAPDPHKWWRHEEELAALLPRLCE
jgi:Sulfotransferase family/Aspartyl/Asparaginyl beta-hydroxylase